MTATATWSCCGTTATYPTALAAAAAPHHCPPTPQPDPAPRPVAVVPSRPARRRPRAAVTGGTATGTLALIGDLA